jgi:hypothetical protein
MRKELLLFVAVIILSPAASKAASLQKPCLVDMQVFFVPKGTISEKEVTELKEGDYFNIPHLVPWVPEIRQDVTKPLAFSETSNVTWEKMTIAGHIAVHDATVSLSFSEPFQHSEMMGENDNREWLQPIDAKNRWEAIVVVKTRTDKNGHSRFEVKSCPVARQIATFSENCFVRVAVAQQPPNNTHEKKPDFSY